MEETPKSPLGNAAGEEFASLENDALADSDEPPMPSSGTESEETEIKTTLETVSLEDAPVSEAFANTEDEVAEALGVESNESIEEEPS